jgi:hypothetical protein
VLLRNSTSFFENSAAGVGNNVQLQGATVYYTFPVPPGHWLPNSECRVYRTPCLSGTEGEPCLASFDKCSLVPDNLTSSDITYQTASVPKSACTGPHAHRCDNQQPCSRRSFIQPCDWNSTQSLLTDPPTKVYTLPVGIPIIDAFPNPCAAGVLGSDDVQYQLSAICQGACPSGQYCPVPATTRALDCPPGSFCPRGSSSPLPCMKGSYSNESNLQDGADCIACPVGSACATGSTRHVPCAPACHR